MQRIFLILFFLLTGFVAFCQTRSVTSGFSARANQTFVTEDGNLSARNSLFTPRYVDTTEAATYILKDTLGNVIYLYSTQSLWVRTIASGSTKKWLEIGSGGGGSEITIGSTTITSGTNTRVLFNNSGVVGEYSISGTGNVAMTASPIFTGTVTIPTPFTLGATSVTSTGTQLNYLNAATGTTGTASTNIVFSTSPLFTTPRLASTSTTGYVWTATDASGNGSFQATSGANTALSNLASVAINTSLISDADNTDDLGSAAISWKDIYSRTLKLDGPTSGTITLQATAVAGTNTITFPALTGTAALLENAQSFTGAKTFTSNLFATGGFHTSSTANSSNLTAQPTGVANETNANWLYDGATNIQYRVGMRGSGNPTLGVDPTTAFQMSAMTYTEGSLVTPYVGGITLLPFSITNGAGSITNTAILRIIGPSTGQAPTGQASSAWISSGNLRLGTAGTSIGTMTFEGNTSGIVTLTPAAAAGTPTFTFGTTTGTIESTLTNTATLDFASTAPSTSTDLTITVTGATDGDAVTIGVPNGSTNANSCFTAWVSAANTVTIRFNNYQTVGSIDPASGTFRASVLKY